MALFAAVVRHGSLSAAARQLGATPSAVSQRLRALEAAHGVVLLHRSTRKLSLTEAGARLLEPAERMLEAAEAARSALAMARDALAGELRVSAPVGFARHVAPALAPLLAAHAGLRLSLLVDDALIDLIDHRIDLALRGGQLPDSNWVARPLGRFDWVICGAPSYLARRGTPPAPEALAGHDWLGLRAGEQVLALTGPAGAAARVPLVPRVVSNNQLTLKQMATAGLGLTMQLRPDVDEELADGRLAVVLPGWGQPPIPVWAVTPGRESQPAKVRLAIEAVRGWLATRTGVAA